MKKDPVTILPKIIFAVIMMSAAVTLFLFELVICNEKIFYSTYDLGKMQFSIIRVITYLLILVVLFLLRKPILHYISESGCISRIKLIMCTIYLILAAFVFFIYEYNKRLNHIYLDKIEVWTFAIVLLLAGICVLLLGDRIEANFLIIGCSLLMAFPFTTLILHMIDEFAHFSEAYNIALGHILNIKTNAFLPSIYLAIPIGTTFNDFISKYQTGLSTVTLLNPKNLGGSPSGYFFLYYVPSAIGLLFGHLLHFNSINEFFIGRFFNLIFYVFGGYIILKTLPFAKNIAAVVLLSPYLVLLATCYSVDGMGFILVMFFIAYCLHITYDHVDMRFKQYLVLAISGLLILFFKGAAYSPVFFFLFIIPGRSILKKEKLIKIMHLIIPIAICMGIVGIGAIIYYALPLGMGDPRGPGVNDVVLQFRTMIHHPIHTLYAYCKFFVNNVFNNAWWEALLPNYFFSIGSDMFIPMIGLWFYVAATDSVDIWLNDRKTLYTKAMIGLFVILSLFLLITLMCLTYSEVGTVDICGVQSRYIFPLLPAFFMLIGRQGKKEISKRYSQYVSFASVMILFICISQNILR